MTAARRVAEYAAGRNRTRVGYGNGTYTTFAYEAGDPRSGYPEMNSNTTPPEVPLPAQAGGAYTYDWVGNMRAAASSNPWQYNTADQLTLWPGIHSYEYDDNGALTAVKTAEGQTEQQTFSYHPSGLMNTATFNGQTLTNLWDADEHRVQFSIAADEYTAVFDVTAGIPAVIKENTPQGTVYYVREPGGELICRVVTVGETTHKWFYHFDELGSSRLITDGSGTVTDRYSYDAYGAVIAHDANTGHIDQPYQYVGQLGYYTLYQAPEFGWLQLGVRFYDPATGKFERRDPARFLGDDHPYLYAAGQPCALVDPSGLWSAWRWMYTGNGNCSNGVYDAAVEAGGGGAKCYLSCMKDLAKIAICIGASGLAPGFPLKKTPGEIRGADPKRWTSLARRTSIWLERRFGCTVRSSRMKRLAHQLAWVAKNKPEYLAAPAVAAAVAASAACATECSGTGAR